MNEKYFLPLDTLKANVGTLNPFSLAESLGIEIRYVPFLNNPEGQYMKILDQPIVLLNERYQEHNKRYFLLAHELHHAIEHADLSGYYVQNNVTRGKLENEANAFAATLLLRLYIEENERLPGTAKEIETNYGFPIELSNEYLKEELLNEN